MKTPERASREELEDFLLSTVRLKLWFLWDWLSKHPEESFRQAYERRADIYRKTIFNPLHLDAPAPAQKPDEWQAVVKDLERLYGEAREAGSLESFESRSMEKLSPLLLGRVERDIEDLRTGKDTANYQCGSLRYELEPDKANPQRISFHIANACSPGSPFDDKAYFPACFLALMAQCRMKFGVTEIATGTWLNSHPKWLELFPEEWQRNLTPPNEDVQWHYGFWGQFITARKTFNRKLGEQFRREGRMPFLPRSSWCSMEAMRRHLLESFPKS